MLEALLLAFICVLSLLFLLDQLEYPVSAARLVARVEVSSLTYSWEKYPDFSSIASP